MTPPPVTLEAVYHLIQERLAALPQGSYVASLAARGEDAMLKKIAEEAAEVLLAAKGASTADCVHELADLWFHLLVWMAHRGLTPQDVQTELGRRFGTGGLAEKAARP